MLIRSRTVSRCGLVTGRFAGPCARQQRVDHPGHRRLAVGAGHVHGRVGPLRAAQQIQQRLNAAAIGDEPPHARFSSSSRSTRAMSGFTARVYGGRQRVPGIRYARASPHRRIPSPPALPRRPRRLQRPADVRATAAAGAAVGAAGVVLRPAGAADGRADAAIPRAARTRPGQAAPQYGTPSGYAQPTPGLRTGGRRLRSARPIRTAARIPSAPLRNRAVCVHGAPARSGLSTTTIVTDRAGGRRRDRRCRRRRRGDALLEVVVERKPGDASSDAADELIRPRLRRVH